MQHAKLYKKIIGDFIPKEPIYYTSLFKSCGIGEYNLKDNLGLVCAVGNELVPQRAKWAKEIYPECEVVCGDIWEKKTFKKLVRLHKEKGCTGVMASPPCQSYTLSNSKRDPSDKRGHLFEPTLKFIKYTVPEWILIENVPQMLTVKLDDGRIVGQYIVEELRKMGYIVHYGVQNAANFFTAQNRKRAVILARKAKAWELPHPFDEIITLEDAIGDLPSIECGEDSGIKYHVAPMWALPQIEVMKHTPTGCSAHDNSVWKPVNVDGSPSKARFRCSFQRKAWDEPCNTILCDSKGVSGFRNCHPGRLLPNGLYSDARPLTVLELLRVTGLPDDYPIPTWASDKLVREAFGECFAPLHVLAIMRGLFD
ncbi:MAG: DNA cytosine methyltransferase [Alphaproteobacteria bacterium]|nr:DNA cytosine methyltransferase [Alphaproteobacteria bacterium]